jgi:hypothetical protein
MTAWTIVIGTLGMKAFTITCFTKKTQGAVGVDIQEERLLTVTKPFGGDEDYIWSRIVNAFYTLVRKARHNLQYQQTLIFTNTIYKQEKLPIEPEANLGYDVSQHFLRQEI